MRSATGDRQPPAFLLHYPQTRPTTAEVLDQARRAWRLPWQLDGDADPAVVVADAGGLIVAIAVTQPLTVVGTLADAEPCYEAETDELPAGLAELERAFRRLADHPDCSFQKVAKVCPM